MQLLLLSTGRCCVFFYFAKVECNLKCHTPWFIVPAALLARRDVFLYNSELPKIPQILFNIRRNFSTVGPNWQIIKNGLNGFSAKIFKKKKRKTIGKPRKLDMCLRFFSERLLDV